MANLYTHQDSNIRKTWVLMTGFLVFVIVIGWVFAQALGSPVVLYIAVGLALIMNIISYWNSDKIALTMSGAKAINREGHEYIYRMVENLTITAGLPMPRLFMIDSPQINAFATGRDPEHAAVAVTTGAVQKLENEELEGVLAHELSHVGNRDILVSTVVVVLAGVIAIMADFFIRITFWGGGNRDRGGQAKLIIALVAAILAPLAATLIKLAVSRQREYLADSAGALLTRYPEGLASALEKIANDQAPMRKASSATAHLFLANPFKGKRSTSFFTKLFMTHPPVGDRIRILRGMNISR